MARGRCLQSALILTNKYVRSVVPIMAIICSNYTAYKIIA